MRPECGVVPFHTRVVVEKAWKPEDEKYDLGNDEIDPDWASRLWRLLIFLLPRWWGLVPCAGWGAPRQLLTKNRRRRKVDGSLSATVSEGAGRGGKACWGVFPLLPSPPLPCQEGAIWEGCANDKEGKRSSCDLGVVVGAAKSEGWCWMCSSCSANWKQNGAELWMMLCGES